MKARFAIVILALALTGCFDLDQQITLNRDGSGAFEFTVTAEGMIGEALKSEKFIKDTKRPVHSETEVTNGRVVHRERVSFARLADLGVEDDDMEFIVRGRDFFGLGPTHVTFRRVVHSGDVGSKRRIKDDDVGSRAALAAMFGDHTYSFAMTVPGSIEHVAPLKLGDVTVKPDISGDYFHHTVTWRMPLNMMFAADSVTFAVDFTAYGSFEDSHSRPSGGAPEKDNQNSD